MGQRFPFFDHLALAQVERIEQWRAKWSDDLIAKTVSNPNAKNQDVLSRSGLTAESVKGFLARNPRSRCEVA